MHLGVANWQIQNLVATPGCEAGAGYRQLILHSLETTMFTSLKLCLAKTFWQHLPNPPPPDGHSGGADAPGPPVLPLHPRPQHLPRHQRQRLHQAGRPALAAPPLAPALVPPRPRRLLLRRHAQAPAATGRRGSRHGAAPALAARTTCAPGLCRGPGRGAPLHRPHQAHWGHRRRSDRACHRHVCLRQTCLQVQPTNCGIRLTGEPKVWDAGGEVRVRGEGRDSQWTCPNRRAVFKSNNGGVEEKVGGLELPQTEA